MLWRCPTGSVLVLLPLYIQSLYFLFYGGRAHIYSGVSFCYNLGPRASPKYKVAACVGPLRLSVRR